MTGLKSEPRATFQVEGATFQESFEVSSNGCWARDVKNFQLAWQRSWGEGFRAIWLEQSWCLHLLMDG